MSTPAPTPRTSDADHIRFMRLALEEAKKCIATPTAFCVGCVIVSSTGSLISTGYSRELPGNTHAEQCAIDKLPSSTSLSGASIYTTMEPCSVRLSGNAPCVSRVLATEISKVYMGVEEPRDFVECEGTRMLRDGGREVWVVDEPGLAEECMAEARRGH